MTTKTLAFRDCTDKDHGYKMLMRDPMEYCKFRNIKVSPLFIDLIFNMVKRDPDERYSIDEVLAH